MGGVTASHGYRIRRCPLDDPGSTTAFCRWGPDRLAMTDAVRRCEAHGHFAGEACPVCGEAGTQVLAGQRRRRLSKFCSGALRHFPGDAGIELDEGGWTTVGELEDAVTSRYGWATPTKLDAVLATDPKGRFGLDERAGSRVVRAAYGHSVAVDLDDSDESAADTQIPDVLYHGTAPRNLDAIMAEGLRPMSRQQVHLSGTVEEAHEVGSRHAADPAVLAVDVAGMRADGREVVKRGDSTYTTDRVPARYLSQVD